MINLFHIEPYTINTGQFDNLLHGRIVQEFEEEFRKYVCAKYSCSTSSATAAIFLCMKMLRPSTVRLPSILPPVVANACIQAQAKIEFYDNVDWVGWSYILHQCPDGSRIIDSAQRVDRDQFKNEAGDDDLMIFSFYPTKPVGSCDGGMIVSNNKEKIRWLKEASMNGTGFSENSWDRTVKFPGWKMYMNSIQAQIALNNLQRLDENKHRLQRIRNFYNDRFGIHNKSDHLYRIKVQNNNAFIAQMKSKGIICGKHYEPLHIMPAYQVNPRLSLPLSEEVGRTTVSIPFHPRLSLSDISTMFKILRTDL